VTISAALVAEDETMVLTGGYGGWPSGDIRYDGLRCRNDVWFSKDGIVWVNLTLSAPWGARAWHGFTSWGSPTAPYKDISQHAQGYRAKLWLVGGSYIGTNGNKVVSSMYGYIDTWWSRDGVSWKRVDYESGDYYRSTLYGTNEWAAAVISSSNTYLGIWGHTLTVANLSSTSNDTVLALVGGAQVGDGSLQDVTWASTHGLFCNIEGTTCSARGVCESGYKGCSCSKSSYVGEYCDQTEVVQSRAHAIQTGLLPVWALALMTYSNLIS
jgi:hypothetical protein